MLAGGGVTPPATRPDARHVFHIYAICTPQRDQLQAALGEREIQSGKHYPDPVHLVPIHRDLGYQPGDFPVAERVAGEELSLPMYAELRAAQIAAVAEEVMRC